MRAEGGDIAGKSVIEAKQPERRLPGFSRDVGFARHIRNHGCQFCIAVVRVASGNAIGQAVIPSLVILLKDRIKVAAISIGGALEYPGRLRKRQSGQIKLTAAQAIAQPINVSTTRGNATSKPSPRRLKQSNTSRVMNIVAWAYCTLRNAKKSTPVITSRTNCPSSEGTNHKIGRPIATPTNVPIILSARRWRVAL